MTALVVCAAAPSLQAQRAGRFLAKEDIVLLGVGLRVEPAQQTVPKDIATIVSTFLQAPNEPGELPAFSPDAVVKATLRGPAFAAAVELSAKPNSPLNIPPLPVAGTYVVDGIRLESGGQVLRFGTPNSVRIDVIEKLLVTQVTSRPLTAAEIREKGIVFDRSSFQAYNFTAAFAIQDHPIKIDFPVVLPSVGGATDVNGPSATVPTVTPPDLPSLKTVIPDTLRVQTQVPNLSVIGFQLTLDLPPDAPFFAFPIPGVIVVPGNIGFLNQFFSVMLMVGNVAPKGSGLVVSDLTAEIVLPPGNDGVVGTPDDPLRMATTTAGEVSKIQPIVQAGLDGKLGTFDDIPVLNPGDSGSAEYLIEGRREGTHVVEMQITGTLHGLPVGPVAVHGRASGSVLVRNPTFTLTFTHPEVVNAGEAYTLDVTVTNTSQSPANFVSLNLYPRNVSGATIVGDPSKQVDTIPPGDSATVSFDLISRVTGKVTAATLDSDDNVAGRFALKTSVGELGVPLSPDSLVLPKEAKALPKNVRDALLGLLGKAWAVATAPAGALPSDVTRFSKQIVLDKAVEGAEAGFRISLHEATRDSASQLLMDIMGSDFARLADFHPDPDDRQFTQNNFLGFDELRRKSVRGDVFAQAVAGQMQDDLASLGVAAFHQDFARKVSYRPGHISVLIGGASGPLPFALTLVDPPGRRVGGVDARGKVVKEIPFSDFLAFTDASGATAAQMALVATPVPGAYKIHLERNPNAANDAPFTLSIVLPDAAGNLRQIVYQGLTATMQPTFTGAPGDPYSLTFELAFPGGQPVLAPAPPSNTSAIVDPPPHVVGVVQQPDADAICIDDVDPPVCDWHLGRVIAALFSQEVTAASVQDKQLGNITAFAVDDNQVVSSAQQPGRRIVFLALRDPIGRFVPRSLTVSGVSDNRGQVMQAATIPIEATVTDEAAVVSGQVLSSDGKPLASNVRLFYKIGPSLIGVSSKSTDATGHYSWDYVLKNVLFDKIVAVDPSSDDFRPVTFTVQRDAQRLNVDIVLLGRGTLQGRTLAEDGKTPLPGTEIAVTSLTDQSGYGAKSDGNGNYIVTRVPVGNIFVEAVNTAAKAKFSLSELIPFAGATTTRDIVLLNVDQTKVTIRTGTLSGHVLRADGATPVSGASVTVYYLSGSQSSVFCPGGFPECPIGVTKTDDSGAFALTGITAGTLRIATFDQPSLQQGGGGATLPADGSASVVLLLSGGLGTVTGIVLDADGHAVASARVGGGLSLTTTDANGRFVLTDVPVGHREIVAVSDALGTRGSAQIDIVRGGEAVNATVVLEGRAAVTGVVHQSDGVTPVPNLTVYLFKGCGEDKICIVATATTDAAGAYRMDKVPLDVYTVSAFNAGLTDGNVADVILKFNGQVVIANVKFRGVGGPITGVVLDADGHTPLKARVGISGDQIVVAGGRVGTGFKHVQYFRIADSDLTTGRFSMTGAFVGPFTISAAGQFSPDPITLEETMPSPGATVNVELRLQATSQIAGTVYQPGGVTPVGPNVVVRYQSAAVKVICATNGTITVGSIVIDSGSCGEIPQGIQEETVVTDGQGRYVVPLVNAGPFTLTAEDPVSGKTAQVRGVVRPGDEAEFPIRLLGQANLTVNVIGSDAKTQIPGARVEVKQLDYPKKDLTFIADSNGTVQFTGGDSFGEGQFVVDARDLRNGFAGRAFGKIAKDGVDVTVNVYLFNATGTVTGTVYRSDGITRVPFAEVTIGNCLRDPNFIGVGEAPCLEGGPFAFDVADANGNYTQDQIPLGEFTVDVFEAATGRMGAASGRIDFNGQTVPVNVFEAARGLVTGTALRSGTLAPLKGGAVRLEETGPSGRALPPLNATTAVDGTFAFPGVSEGSFRLTAAFTQPDHGGSASATGTIDHEGQAVDIPLIVDINRDVFGTAAGTVYNADGSRAAFANVEICYSGVNCVDIPPPTVTAGVDGTFALPGVPLGRFSVTARSQTSKNVATALGELDFENDTTNLVLKLTGLRQITGTVVFDSGQPAAGAEVTLQGHPSSGCTLDCTTFADTHGNFAFVDVPADTFTIYARDPVSGIRGTAGGSLAPTEQKVVRIVLEATRMVTGRVLFASGKPAQNIVGELVADTGTSQEKHLFLQTPADGTFVFVGVPLRSFTLQFTDPIGPGIARRSGPALGDVSYGDVTLDEAPPGVASTTPPAGAVGVPQNASVQIVFSEPIDLSTVNATDIVLNGPAASVPGVLNVSGGDTTVTFTPLDPLHDETRYTLRVTNIKDRIGKALAADFVTSFTTVDITPPVAVDISPAPGVGGASVVTPIRIKYSEPFDPTKLRAPPVLLSGSSGAVAGRVDLAFGNTTIVFTPLLPLDDDATYHVQVAPVVDLAGNAQPLGLDYTFSTTDHTPPQVVSLTADHNGVVVENGIATVTADVGTAHDVGVVDFFINDSPAASSRTSPFQLKFQATPAFGKPGDRIKVSAAATDTSGNRGDAVTTLVTVVADQPPAVTITQPADGFSAHNGERVVVTVRATDDLGSTQVGYKAQTGNPQDAMNRAISPTSIDRTESFAFFIPNDAVPGSTIQINASAVDTKGQVGAAPPVGVVVLDSVPPTVTITGVTTGVRLLPGQQTSAVVSAQDLGSIRSISFTAGGATAFTDVRSIDPAQPSVVTSFPFSVPANAHPTDTVTLDAVAVDKAGNVGHAARVILPIADLNPPTLTLQTATGSVDMVPGSVVDVVANFSDEIGVTRVDIVGDGAFTFGDAHQITPPNGSGQTTFAIHVPAGIAAGSMLTLHATATDISGNVSAPVTLTLSGRVLTSVVLPPSVIVLAGDSQDVTVELSTPAPTGGVEVDFTSADPTVASVTAAVVFAEGETQKSVTVLGLTGGTVAINALIANVQRASMTAAILGGVVSGTVSAVFDSQLVPVAGAQVTIGGGPIPKTTVTDAQGHYLVEDAPTFFSVKVLDPVTHHIGFTDGHLNATNGFAHVNVLLFDAGTIHGTILQADGKTAVGQGVTVDLLDARTLETKATTHTDASGAYEFPLVEAGNYLVDASDVNGNRGRAPAVISTSGQDVAADVTFLGRGTVTGTILDGANHPVPNAELRFSMNTVFGQSDTTFTNAAQDGTYRFDSVLVGQFQIQAHDTRTDTGASVSGTMERDGQLIVKDIHLSSFGTLQGTVVRQDGTTPVHGATVTGSATGVFLFTRTDDLGRYQFGFLPLGNVFLRADDEATRGIAIASTALATNGQVLTQDLRLKDQGTFVVTVTDSNGNPVSGAQVNASATSPDFQATDTVSAVSGGDGTVIIQHVLAGNATITAFKNSLVGFVQTTLAADEVKRITVSLESTGGVAGTVLAPDNNTPITDGTIVVTLGSLNPFYKLASATTGPDGMYRIDGLKLLYDYYVLALDAQGRLRGVSKHVKLTTNGQVETRNFTFIGIGGVQGRVLNPGESSSASNLTVQVRSLTPDLGGYGVATTDAAGFYTIGGVVAGNFLVTTGDASRRVLGEATGAITTDGQIVTEDIILQSNAVNLPVNKWDANNALFDIQRDASLGTGGPSNIFNATFGDTQGAFQLDVVAGGVANRFTGSTVGTVEDGGREVVVRQNGLAGLNVARKVFVPKFGYFARYLEILSNPTASPITVDLRVSADLSRFGGLSIAGTSSGDAALDVSDPSAPDRWVVIDAGTTNHFYPKLAFVFDGVNAQDRVASAALVENPDCPFSISSTCYSEQLAYRWNGVTIQPNETVVYMHFVAQQPRLDSAQASAERLVQLPGEALAGLSVDEIADVRNFAVPPDGSSALDPLPSLVGHVTGRLFEGDGASFVANPSRIPDVTLTTTNILFPRSYSVSTDVFGQFDFTSSFNDTGTSIAIPEDSFTLQGQHPQTSLMSPVVAGSFAPGATSAAQDVTFTNAGIVHGLVRRHTGAVVTNGSVALNAGGFFAFLPVGSDGTYRIGGVPAGSATVGVSVPAGQGTALNGSATFNMIAGTDQPLDLIIQPTGAVAGTVRNSTGATVPNVAVVLLVPATLSQPIVTFQRSTRTDSAGNYLFPDVPVGSSYIVQVTDPATFITVQTSLAVGQDHTTIANLSFDVTGTVQLQALFAGGAPAANASVQVKTTQNVIVNGVTDANGRLTINNVTAGPFTITVQHPRDFYTSVSITGTVATQGQTVPVTATLPGVGSAQVHAAFPDGSPAPGLNVDYTDAAMQWPGGLTDANGNVTLTLVRGAFTVRVYDAFGSPAPYRSASGRVVNENDVVAVTVVMRSLGTVSGNVTNADGSPAANQLVSMFTELNGNTANGFTDASGRYSITDVPIGNFRTLVTDYTRNVAGSFSGTLAQHGDSTTADIHLTDVPLPASLSDANNFVYQVNRDGEIQSNSFSANSLSIQAGTPFGSTFQGDFAGTPSLDGRQLAIRNYTSSGFTFYPSTPTSIAGLTVSRKVYVPASGYFARSLDVLENPGQTPVTVDVSLSGSFGYNKPTATSSGDADVTAADEWVVGDSRFDFFPVPAVADIAQGPNAPLAVSQAGNQDPSLSYMGPVWTWKQLTVPAGGRVIFMHFTVQEVDATAARAAAERLAQLPPEALAGLAPDEIAAIKNFAVPADGTSSVPPFATVTGHVFAADATTPVPSALVTLSGNTNAIFPHDVTLIADANARFTFNTLSAGTFTLRAAHPVTGAQAPQVTDTIADAQTLTRNVVFSNTGTLHGVVRFASGLPAAGAQLTLAGTSTSVQITTAADGTYSVTGLPADTVNVTAQGLNRSVTGVASVIVGQTTTLDLRLPALATIHVSVRQVDGSPSAYANIYTRFGSQANFTFYNGSDADGTLDVTDAPEGTFEIRATSYPAGNVIGTFSGVVQGSDDGRTINVVITSNETLLRGTIFGADGHTPVGVPVRVEVFDVASGQKLAQVFSDSTTSSYQFLSVAAGAQGFRVVAHAPNDPTITVQGTGAFTDTIRVRVVDLALPVTLIKGTVRFPDGSPVPSPSVFVTQTSAGRTQTLFAGGQDAGGHYTVVGASVGAFRLTAQDSASGLTATAAGSLAGLATTAIVDVVLPLSGSISGSVIAANGHATLYPDVLISTLGDGAATMTHYARSFSTGGYAASRVPLGTFYLQACGTPDYDTGAYTCSGVTGELTSDGQALTVNVRLPAAGTVAGTVHSSDGVPVPNAYVRVEDSADTSLFNFGSLSAQADASGHYSIGRVQAGAFRVVALDPRTIQPIGTSEGTVAGGQTSTVDVTAGTIVATTRTFVGADNFKYVMACNGTLNGGAASGSLTDPYVSGSMLKPFGATYPCMSSARTDPAGQQFVLGTATFAGLSIDRKMFVPASGGFARYLEILSNPTATAITATVQIETTLAAGDAARVVLSPASTSNTFAITDDSTPGSTLPALAHVFGGPNAAVSTTATQFETANGTVVYRWKVTIPAGQTAILMHFAVQRAPADTGGAESQARALVELLDPNALTGMTAQERTLVVNFNVP